jgi:MFS superfamily sulfate permease-like transporter
MKTLNIKNGITHLKNHWKDDLISGFSVSLIALPLCLGIAIASGFPPIAGIFAAIIGGIFVSRINGSHLTISGPAAGLIVVNLAAIESMGGAWSESNPGGYGYALAAILVSGLIIALFGFLKVGKLGEFIPSAAVHGMLAAIGIIIIVKQFFPAIGVKAEGHELFEVIMNIPKAFLKMDVKVACIALGGLVILIVHSMIKIPWMKKVPAPLLVLFLAIPLASYFGLGGTTLVDLPNDLSKSIVTPDFGKIATSVFWMAVLAITLVTTIESILSAIAVDQIDPKKQKSDYDQDLIGLGAGAAMSGGIGGLPMISEIVRSSANIGYGGKSQWSNFFHGVFLLVFILILRPIIEMIPLSALAAMLIFTGFRLASPREFKHMWEVGKAEFIVFFVTCFTVLATDLLIGIAAGILLNLIIVVIKGQKLNNLFQIRVEERQGIYYLKGSLTFANYLSLKRIILKQYASGLCHFDFSEVEFVDHNVMSYLETGKDEWSRAGKQFLISNHHHLKSENEYPTSEKRRGNHFELVLSARDKELLEYTSKKGYDYNPGSIVGFDFQNFKLLNNVTVKRAKNVIYGDKFKVADIQAVERLNLSGGEVNFTAFLMRKTDKPPFCLGTLDVIETFRELFSKTDIRFENHPNFSNFYLLTSENEAEVRVLFTPAVLDYLETHKKYRFEVNHEHILVYQKAKRLTVDEIDEMITFSLELLRLFAKGMHK